MSEITIPADSSFKKIGVIGLGYVGLPLALLFAKKGFDVIGIDVDQRKVNSLKQHTSYIPDISNDEIKQAITSGKFTADASYQSANRVDVIIICVPTPLTSSHSPDLSYLIKVGNSLVPQLKQGQLVILESSTYPGTTRNELLPILEKSGLKTGVDFFLAYSPERIDPGNKHFTVEAVPKVISGISSCCKEQIYQLYSQIYQQVVAVSSPEAAELTKLLENTFRFINISFINEMAILCDKLHLDVWEVIDAANTKPYGFTAFYPGPGIGGHCIPVDPLYLQWVAQQNGTNSQFIELSHQLNQNIINYIVDQIMKLFPEKNAYILIYGAAYKKNINDARESSIFPIIERLMGERFRVDYHDPFIPEITVNGMKMQSVELTEEQLSKADCVLLLTDHTDVPLQKIADHAKLVYDTRNMTEGLSGNAKFIRMGGGFQ
ncbi:nucleotide sugar dehydrogenase [Bacillus sp. ISL-75]|uniref:nucleotide sugar dehydrogenase n=1 Tax=Bacillus sp. ISL-75 TaxID=2819137 RepID=UPI001BEBAB8D|nr:nucleotide sugar dehydrogenase [Bacillus sp. ISL-75]MBT2726219.1 nucleotide sugar dehydrogenase [Bacillus sp. ISL-75]